MWCAITSFVLAPHPSPDLPMAHQGESAPLLVLTSNGAPVRDAPLLSIRMAHPLPVRHCYHPLSPPSSHVLSPPLPPDTATRLSSGSDPTPPPISSSASPLRRPPLPIHAAPATSLSSPLSAWSGRDPSPMPWRPWQQEEPGHGGLLSLQRCRTSPSLLFSPLLSQ